MSLSPQTQTYAPIGGALGLAVGQTAVSFFLDHKAMIRIFVGAGFSGTTLTASESTDGTNYLQTYNGSTAVAFPVPASGSLEVSADQFPSVGYIRLTSDQTQASAVCPISIVAAFVR